MEKNCTEKNIAMSSFGTLEICGLQSIQSQTERTPGFTGGFTAKNDKVFVAIELVFMPSKPLLI